MYKIAFVIFRHLIARGPLPQLQASDVGIWHLFIIMKSMTEFSTSYLEHVLYAFSHAHLMIVELNQEEPLCATVRRHSEV